MRPITCFHQVQAKRWVGSWLLSCHEPTLLGILLDTPEQHGRSQNNVAIIQSHKNEALPFRRGIAMFKDPTEVERAERDQEADSARINAAIEAAEKAITALAARQLDSNEMRNERSAIRDRTIHAIRDVRHNIIKRATAAKETERWMVQKWLREVNNAKIMHEFTADLQKVSTRDLVDYLRYLIQVGDLSRIQVVNAVFVTRTDNRRYQASFDKMLGQFTLSQLGTIGARIANICDLADKIDLKITQLFSAH